MELDNQTRFAARVLRVERQEGHFEATLVVKATFELGDEGHWFPAIEQLPIMDDKCETPFGIFHTDCFVRKDGVDVCILGTARSEPRTPVKQIRLSIGAHSNELNVFGDRRWIRSGRRLVPSSPVPFDQMEISYARAYGGTTEHDYETFVWMDNPSGRGYYLSEVQAEGSPLPNIEAAGAPQVKEWSDQPPVAGWAPYPFYWGLRAREGVEPPKVLGAGEFGRLKARLNNHAHPLLVIPSLQKDAEIRIRGFRTRELVYNLPAFSPLAEIQLGGQSAEAHGGLDGVFLWADLAKMTLTHRIHFVYDYNKGEHRRVRLIDTAAWKGT